MSTESFEAGGAKIRVEFAERDRPEERGDSAVGGTGRTCGLGVYGRFPLRQAGVLIEPVPGDDVHGTTWGGVRGVQGFTRIRFGQHTTQKELASDWVMTHELVHMAFRTRMTISTG